MKLSRQRMGMLAAAVLAGVGISTGGSAPAGCPCRGGGGGMVAAPAGLPFSMSPFPAGAAPLEVGAYPAWPAPMVETVQPPPGTLGRTYQMKSRPVPVKMHPRVGMLDVNVPNATIVMVHDMSSNRTEDSLEGFQDMDDPNMWHFQSEPLLPGLPHVYRIEASVVTDDGVQMQQRYVRLIRGRLIEVEF